jgi:hypothetical protein
MAETLFATTSDSWALTSGMGWFLAGFLIVVWYQKPLTFMECQSM